MLIWGPCFIIYEFISVSIYRIERKRKLFQGGLDHIHHYLQNYFKSNVIAVITINLLNLFLIAASSLVFFSIYIKKELITKKLGLVDLPDKKLKNHKKNTPVIGGVVFGILAILILGFFFIRKIFFLLRSYFYL